MYWSNKRQHFSWIICILFNVIDSCAAIDQNGSTNDRRLVPAAATPPNDESLTHTFPKYRIPIIRYHIKQASVSGGDVKLVESKQPVIGTETERSSLPAAEEEADIPVTDELKYAETLYQSGLMFRKGSLRDESEKAYRLFQEAAQLGHIGAKEELATAHLFGVHLPVDFRQAEKYFQEGAETGSLASHYGLYFMHSVGFIPGASIAQALLHLSIAAVDGNHLAQMALAYRYLRGINLEHRCAVPLIFYQKLASHVISKITTADGELVQRVRVSDFEEHSTRQHILIDEELFQRYQISADLGNRQAQYSLGVLHYLRGIDFDKAAHYLHLAAAAEGNSHAWAYLGKLYARNTSIEQHQEKAVKYFQLAAANDNPIGQTGLGVAYYYGAGIEQSYENALKLFQRAANQSHGEAQLMLGIMHAHGINMPRNDEQAFKWFQAAARSGHILGIHNLGSMHATGTGVLPSCPIACDFYKNVAERGSWSQMFNEAFRLYRRGKIAQAFTIYLYLAELGYEIAQSNVAYMLDRMPDRLSSVYRSQQKRYRKALLYWDRAAHQGYQDAHIKLGDYYYYGLGTQLSYESAAIHYKHASERSGNAQGTFNLGYMHEKGLGPKRNLSEAQRFYRKTMEQNADAYYPAILALTKVRLEAFLEDFILSARVFTSETIYPTHTADSVWDLFFITILAGLMGILFRIRRNRAA